MNGKTIVQMVGWGSLIAGLCIGIVAFAQDAARRENKDKMTPETKAPATNVADVERMIKELNTKYQLAVKNNDAETMSSILADDFVLVTGRGKVYTKGDLLEDARDRTTVYEQQEDSRQTVRVWGDTAVITALLWEKGVSDGKPFDKKLWFSDVYKLTPSGWKYVFAQSSIPIPADE
jgi:ketosteroid isomerase-like protein